MKDTVIINGIEYVPKVIAPEPVKVGRWKPELERDYWYANGTGRIIVDRWDGYESDKMRYALGDVYQTEALATQARDKQLLMVELQDFADRVNEGIDRRYFCYNLYFDEALNEWICYKNTGPVAGTSVFYSEQGMAAAIAHFGDRLNLLK